MAQLLTQQSVQLIANLLLHYCSTLLRNYEHRALHRTFANKHYVLAGGLASKYS